MRQWRSYSLSAAVGHDPAITVTAIGFVSTALARDTKVGDILFLDTPQGDFVLPEHPRPLLMLTAGSGLTPVMSMIRTLVPRRPDADVVLIHSARTPRRGPLPRRAARARRPVPRPDGQALVHPRGGQGRRLDLTDVTDLETLCPDWRDRAAYACGPTDFLDAATELWLRDGTDGTPTPT